MKRHRSPRPFRFLFFSVVVHLLLVVLLWRFMDDPRRVADHAPMFLTEFFRLETPRPVVIEPPPEVAADVQREAPAAEDPQPQIAASSFALSLANTLPSHRDRQRADGNQQPRRSYKLSPQTPTPKATGQRSATIAASPVPLESTSTRERGRALYSDAPMDVGRLDTNERLSDGSLSLHDTGGSGATRIRRGGGGYSWGAYGNAEPKPGRSDGTFRNLMLELAEGLAAQAQGEKLDVVFLVDATGSMEDNILGIRAYMKHFAERLDRRGKDVAFGAVVFTDLVVERPRARGVTEDYNDVRNWLYHTDYMGGGDLAESGLEALMAAVEQIDYRRGAERYLLLVTDGPVHDADYDGQSVYSLDQVLDALSRGGFHVTVVGIDYLPLKQLARATGGQWYPIPGRGYLEDQVNPVPEKSVPGRAMLTQVDSGEYKVSVPPSSADWVRIRWKVLNPLGQLGYGPVSETKEMAGDALQFRASFPVAAWTGDPFPYTLICHVEDSTEQETVLRKPIWVR